MGSKYRIAMIIPDELGQGIIYIHSNPKTYIGYVMFFCHKQEGIDKINAIVREQDTEQRKRFMEGIENSTCLSAYRERCDSQKHTLTNDVYRCIINDIISKV